jgi:hypothetical protein
VFSENSFLYDVARAPPLRPSPLLSCAPVSERAIYLRFHGNVRPLWIAPSIADRSISRRTNLSNIVAELEGRGGGGGGSNGIFGGGGVLSIAGLNVYREIAKKKQFPSRNNRLVEPRWL